MHQRTGSSKQHDKSHKGRSDWQPIGAVCSKGVMYGSVSKLVAPFWITFKGKQWKLDDHIFWGGPIFRQTRLAFLHPARCQLLSHLLSDFSEKGERSRTDPSAWFSVWLSCKPTHPQKKQVPLEAFSSNSGPLLDAASSSREVVFWGPNFAWWNRVVSWPAPMKDDICGETTQGITRTGRRHPNGD